MMGVSCGPDLSFLMQGMKISGFGGRIRASRRRLGLTQQQLGLGLRVDGTDVLKQSIADWELGRHYPRADELGRLVLRLGVTADYLLFGETP